MFPWAVDFKVLGWFGFVEMSNVSEAEKAMEALNLTSVGGRNINVNEARPQKDRPRRGFGQY